MWDAYSRNNKYIYNNSPVKDGVIEYGFDYGNILLNIPK